MGGPTEATVWGGVLRVVSVGASVPIGVPIANTQLYILDGRLNPAPIGVPGDLYIGGAGLARGYFDRPASTAEKFLPNPFSDVPGMRLYPTGDRARWSA